MLPHDSASDFQISVSLPASLRRWYKPQVRFFLDDFPPFLPLPKAQAFALLEWGMNWCVAANLHTYLLVHGAVLEKDGDCFVFPAPPGSGKSTLCTYLAFNGWRLLSDEMTVINMTTGLVHPFVRPICLKNNSIPIVKNWFPEIQMTDVVKDTAKGTVAHVKPPVESVKKNNIPAKIRAIVLPRYTPDSQLDIYALNKCDAFEALSKNTFNEGMLGTDGFNSLCSIVEGSDTVEIHYNDVQQVMNFLEEKKFTL